MIKKAIRGSKDYPYMYARVSAKRAKLLDERDYEDLLKMSPNQVANRLAEGSYGREMDELGARYDGTELVELALNRNLAREMSNLVDMAPEPLSEIITVYLRRFDVLTLKRLLRAKDSGSTEDAKDLFVPVNRYSFKDISDLMEKSYEEIVESISFPDSEIDYQGYIDSMELVDVESGLDMAYAHELEALCTKTASRQFKEFIESEMEHENIITALRLKKYGFGSERIRENIVNGRETALVETIVEAASLEDAIEAISDLRGTDYPERLEDVEQQLQVERLRKALKMLHSEPLGATSILGYIVAKHTEVKNLRMLNRALETEVKNRETVRNNLVIP